MGTTVLPPLPFIEDGCPKCGYEPCVQVPLCPECGKDLGKLVPPPAHQMVWIPAAGDDLAERPAPLPYREPREHMQITCRRCAYRWPAATEDSTSEAA